MEYTEVRELVRIRFELRRLAVGGSPGSEGLLNAGPLLDRMGQLAAKDAREFATVAPEIGRWRAFFGLA